MSHKICIYLSAGSLGIIYQTIDLFIPAGHGGKSQRTYDHDRCPDDPGQYTQGHVALGLLQDGFRLIKNPAADNNAHHHGYGRPQVVFLFQFVFHLPLSFSSVPDPSCFSIRCPGGIQTFSRVQMQENDTPVFDPFFQAVSYIIAQKLQHANIFICFFLLK